VLVLTSCHHSTEDNGKTNQDKHETKTRKHNFLSGTICVQIKAEQRKGLGKALKDFIYNNFCCKSQNEVGS
jgi:hypothetical protein